jgi:hypothetical protein
MTDPCNQRSVNASTNSLLEISSMYYRQFTLIAIATLLLSPNLVSANEIDVDRNLSVGNVQILSTPNGTVIQTPKIQVVTPKSSPGATVSRTRRTRTSVRRTRTATPLIFNKKVNSDSQTTVRTTTTDSGNTSTTQSSTIRSSSDSGNTQASQSSSNRQQSTQCSGSGTTISRSTSTVNGRTVSSESHTNCN